MRPFVFLFVTSMTGTLYGYLIGLAIDKARVSSFGLAVAVLFLIYIINFVDSLIFDRYGRIYMEKCANNIMEKIGCAVYEKVGLLPARAFEEKSSGEFINRITNDLENLKLNGEVLFKIKDKKIEETYSGSDEILKELSNLKEK